MDLNWHHYPRVYDQFREHTGDHEMNVLRDDGLYKHLRFAAPGTGIWHFDLVTWPGYLTIVGDIGSGYVFTRTADMLAFFDHGQPAGHINPGYWAEKLTGGRHSVLTYSEEAFKAHVADQVEAVSEFLPNPSLRAQLRARVEDEVLSEAWAVELAVEALYDFEFEGHQLDEEMDSEAWTDYDHHFLLACHAILWGAKRYHAEHGRLDETEAA